MHPGGPIASVTLDYGHVVGGLPSFDIAALSGSPTLRTVYSEAQQYLGTTGDASYPDGNEVNVSYVGNAGAASLSRVNTYRPTAPGPIVNRLVQGGERFEVIQLTTPGSVALSGVGIRRLVPAQNLPSGSFESSDAALNEIWNLGARTLALDTVPARSLPPTWSVTPQGLVVQDSAFSIYQAGTKWSGYTASFDVQVVRNEAGWMVGATPSGGFRLVLAADNDVLAAPNTLRLTHPFVAGVLAQVPLPFDLQPGTWHRVRTVTGSALQVYVDDKLVLSAPIPTSGSFGFAGYDGSIGCFRNLQIDAGTGSLSSTLTDPAVLDQFGAGTNAAPSIVDGAKRDRYVWSGDLAVSGPTLYYTGGATDSIKGALRLFAAYQRSSGEFPGDLPPQLALGIASGDSMPDAYYYSLSYSTYFLTTLYDYYLYTGDLKFVQSNWSAVRRSLGYLQGLTNSSHLIVTDPSDDADWHPHDASKLTGTVTEFNVLYYRALRDAARLAEALGDENARLNYDTQAIQVKGAINATLFNAGAGLYDISDQMRGPVAQDANSMAVLFDVAPPDRQASILARMDTALGTSNGPLAFSPDGSANPVLSQVISPFVSSFDVWAHFETGDATGGLSIIRSVWGHMRSESPYYSGATWEALAPDGIPVPAANAGGTYASLAHGWSTGATAALSRYVLGVRPREAGYRSWLVEPQAGDLSWARGRTPTPYGPIDVDWRRSQRGFDLTLNVPPGTYGTIGIPALSGTKTLSVNGRIVEAERPILNASGPGNRNGYLYLRGLPGGRYRISSDTGS
ncbi:MAG TPA: alpha-L-rhamnosidase C-terminal domain-containing protein [Trinickia sp.]|uniref:alpha-L-rhamnosidase-related protein n=1 Tax=Trinickia sp. TaxID=2571163 RepID=UPI002BF12A14|nr:alpha-L-rhamnosidase C-terminal domain-containing protein [Trinickia sp.]HVW50023.1 alpha-L-rhamnosidase C-terminal domain-containing protein [Trinickia sp.]